MLALVRMPAYALHGQMQQRQRLKSLHRFSTQTNAVLITTDVAARGLDIPLVQHVVHYNVPHTAEIFVHRSGRTARAFTAGLSLSIVAAPVSSVKS
jgi:ATP-dependent RNA helicase DDX24/MAK5